MLLLVVRRGGSANARLCNLFVFAGLPGRAPGAESMYCGLCVMVGGQQGLCLAYCINDL